MHNHVAAIILAAGKGTRMKAPPTKNKVIFDLADKPIISYTVDMLEKTGLQNITVVIGYAGESVKNILGNRVNYAVQADPQGTGHAVKTALPYISDDFTTIISMYGDDSAFYNEALMETLIKTHDDAGAQITVVTIHKDDPTGLGRIIRNSDGLIQEIIEEKNATPEQRALKEINTGLYCFNHEFLKEAVNAITPNPISGEYYLTDVIGYATRHQKRVHALVWPNNSIWFGVNTPDDLEQANVRMRAKNESH